MENKQLIDKFIDGEITEEQFEDEKSKLSPEDLEKLNKDAEVKLPDAVKKLISVRRGINKISSKDNTDSISKLREENLESAKQKIFTELGFEKEEDKIAFMEGFKSNDSGNVTVENIMKDMKKYYASTKSDEYFELKQKQIQREQEAEEFNAQNGGANGSGGSGGEDKKVSKEVRDYMQQSAKIGKPISAEQAERALRVASNNGHIR